MASGGAEDQFMIRKFASILNIESLSIIGNTLTTNDKDMKKLLLRIIATIVVLLVGVITSYEVIQCLMEYFEQTFTAILLVTLTVCIFYLMVVTLINVWRKQ